MCVSIYILSLWGLSAKRSLLIHVGWSRSSDGNVPQTIFILNFALARIRELSAMIMSATLAFTAHALLINLSTCIKVLRYNYPSIACWPHVFVGWFCFCRMFTLVEIFSVYPFLEVIFIMTWLRFGRPEGSPLQHISSVGSGWGARRLIIIKLCIACCLL